uniref:Nudix hydrolase domain-containing protein n=1 Tax=Kalanchoe fedtschenkoi TaxID=63787 RepID=A0A7N0TRH1_KALFE
MASGRSTFSSASDSRILINVVVSSPYKAVENQLPRSFQPPLPHRKPATASISCCSSTSPSSTSVEVPPDGYRRNVGICLINRSKQIFAALRLNIPNAWQMPQGGIDEGEIPRDAVMRELREETGVYNVEVIAEVPYWLTYNFPPDVRKKLNRRWRSDWKGQAQKWFLLRFTGKEDEINLLGDGTEKAEFRAWSWMSPEQVVELAVDFKKPVYKEVLSAFAEYLE